MIPWPRHNPSKTPSSPSMPFYYCQSFQSFLWMPISGGLLPNSYSPNQLYPQQSTNSTPCSNLHKSRARKCRNGCPPSSLANKENINKQDKTRQDKTFSFYVHFFFLQIFELMAWWKACMQWSTLHPLIALSRVKLAYSESHTPDNADLTFNMDSFKVGIDTCAFITMSSN